MLSGEMIVGLTHELAASLGIIGWYDRVDTHSNPVDKFSRGEMAGPWKLVRIRFPPSFFTTDCRIRRLLIVLAGDREPLTPFCTYNFL